MFNEFVLTEHQQIEKAARALREGSLVAFPTETVYGLGADISRIDAVERIFEVKGRPKNHPLIVHISNLETIGEIAEVEKEIIGELIGFWPGPLTLVLRKSDLVDQIVTGGQDSIAIRIPRHPVAISLLNTFHSLGGLGIAAPSANRYGKTSPTRAQDVLHDIGSFLDKNDFILDGGQSECGLESTILDLTGEIPTIRRLGSITLKEITEILGTVELDLTGQAGRISGSEQSHYAPSARVHMKVGELTSGGFVAMNSIPTPKEFVRIAAPKSLEEYAHVLYQSFREADNLSLKDLVVIAPEGDGLADAIRDRIWRASS